MSSEHHHHPDLKGKSLLWTIFLNIAITVAQVIGAIFSHSLSLLTDALHNFSDVMALVISFIANKLSKKKYTPEQSYGYKRAEILAAFINAATLLGISMYLIFEASERFVAKSGPEINASMVAWLAGFSIVANGISVLIVKKHAGNNMNMRSAYLHLFSDMLSSIAVLAGGLLMFFFNIDWIDALLSVIIAIYLIVSSWKLMVKTIKVLMQFTPSDINMTEIANHLKQIKLVKNVHHIHIWQLNDMEYHLEAHLDIEKDVPISETSQIVTQAQTLLQEKFNISHSTIQPEFNVKDDKRMIVDERHHQH
ncbi:cation transporter [Marinilabiliaceae bacterium JC017]|nr:cation transporter [Marinilabiliaceae bacterium JC017]